MKNRLNLLLLPLVFAVVDAVAQDATAPADTEVNKLETVTVTGSRISNPNVVSPTPVSVLTAADIAAVGATNIGDLLTQMPQLSTMFTMGNSGGANIGTVAMGLQNLRNLGPQRTLVLVNGRRYVSSSTDTAGVDTNLIPADWIDRVEIITGGASAIYGADAVSGVVNFILKKQYQGANLHVQMNRSEHGGQDKQLVSLTAGSNFAGDRGNVAISLEHSRNGEMMFHDRFGDAQYTTILTPGNQYTRVLFANAGSYTNYEGGEFVLGGRRYVFDPNGEVRAQRFGGLRDNRRCTDCDYLHTNQTLELQPYFNRNSINLNASFDLRSAHRLYFEGAYTFITADSRFQPAFGSTGNGIGGFGGGYQIQPDNAYVTPALAALMNGQPIVLNRFDVDAGLRIEEHTRDTGRMVFGANGQIGEDWQYDASFNYGVTRDNFANVNNRNLERFYASIDAVRDPATGKIVCRSTIDPGALNPNFLDADGNPQPITAFGRDGCIPTSILGAGAVNQAARNWFNFRTYQRNRLQETVVSGTLTNNNLFAVPTGAGSASLVLGVEYRKEEMTQIHDPLDLSGAMFNNAIPDFTGKYDVKEGFVEFGLPVLADKPFVKNLSVDAAIRESDYDTIGHTETWKWGLDWAFDDNVRMRGTMSYAVRAPNINELFSGQGQNFFNVTDPCSVSRLGNAPDPALRKANCIALGVPVDSDHDPSASVTGVTGSNPNLQPENAKTYTFGFVVTPQFLDGAGFNVDYWNIKLGNAIAVVDSQTIVDRCVDSTSGINNTYCANARRDPNTHLLSFITQINLNLAGTHTSGIDLGAYYSHDIGPGRLRAELNATRVITEVDFPFQEDPSQFANNNGTDGFPKWKATLGATYTLDPWTFNWNTRYFSHMLRSGITKESYEANPYQVTPILEGGRVYNDMRVAYGAKNAPWQVYFGVNNVFDRKPPVNVFGTTTGGGLYDIVGRSAYVGANYRF